MLILRRMRSTDLVQVVDVHLASFPGFFLTFLGRRFLTLLYRAMAADPDGVVLVARRDGQLVGFVAGVLHQSGFYGRLIKRRWWQFALASLPGLTRNPTLFPRLVRALQRPLSTRQAAAEACLMSIAVRPEAENTGVGSQLVKAFCRELTARGARACCLTTDRDGNDRANTFYQRLGFQLGHSFVTPEGRPMNEYFILLPLKD